MEEQIYSEIQRQIYYMIPEKWSEITLYASVDQNMTGELFFYYTPKSITKQEPINCYEIPKLFDIQEDEYIELLTKIYNNIKILKQIYMKEYNKNWTWLTINIDDTNFNLIYGYEDLENSPFSPYERHVIWRKNFLELEPVSRKDKKIIDKYEKIKNEYIFEIEYMKMKKEKQPVKNVISYERVLTVDEAIAQSTQEKEKNSIFKNILNKKKKNKLDY